MAKRSIIRIEILGTLLTLLFMGCNISPEAREAKFLKRGESLLEHQEVARALLEFRNAAKAVPRDAEPHYQMGRAFLKTGNIASAVGELRKAIELNPKHNGAQLALAEVMTSSRDNNVLHDAEVRLEAILAASPDNVEAADALAMAEWKLGKADEAIERLQSSLQKFPTNLQSSVALAEMQLRRKDFAAAEAVIKKAVVSAPKSAEAVVALGQLYLVLRQTENANEQFRRALQLDANNVTALMGIAAIQVAGNHMQDADKTYQRLSALPDKRYRSIHALFLHRLGKRDQALVEFEKLFKADPQDRTIRTRLLAAYIEMGRTAEAQSLLAGVLKKNPKDSDALLQRSEMYLQWGKFNEAEEDLKQVLRLRPDSPEAHYALARDYRAQGRLATERQELTEALRIKPQFLAARLALARSFNSRNAAKSAVDVLDQAPVPQKRELSVIIERNWALMRLGDLKAVREVINEWLPRSRNPELLVQDAVIKIAQGDYAGARESAEAVLQHAPDSVRAARLVTDSYLAQHQVSKALERLKAIAAANPRSAPIQQLMGQFYLRTGDATDARKAFEAAKAANSHYWEADLSLAQMDQKEAHPDAARQRLERTIAADPKNVRALLLMADVEKSNRAAAIARYRAVIDVDASNVIALNNLAYYLIPDDPDEALKYAQQAEELAPRNPTVEDTLGWVYYQKGIYSAAIAHLKEAVAKEPTPRREFHLAMSYIKSGDKDLGQKTLRSALQKDPNLAKNETAW